MIKTPAPLDPAVTDAARTLCAGGIVAYPTEAVYGLGCDPRNAEAVQRLLEIKQRDPLKGLILIAASFDQLKPYLVALDDNTRARVLPTWPGPVTWLLPARDAVSPLLRGAHPTLAVRVTAHPLAAALCRAFGGALVSTSANRSNEPPARTAQQVRAQLGADLDYLLDGVVGSAANPTEIRDAATGAVLRPA
ncbi:MAG: Sua5/YciO/YrdC/YwlC family protein [Gammaproteobacteria bacterium]|nr:Sua5/YciO/YrdC/YwlC family protein [Gammaproteobacteria bacterium]